MPENSDDLEQDDIITLTASDGEEIDFLNVAGIALGGSYYVILQPVELLEGMGEDEALVFEVKRGANGEDSFTLVLEEDITDAVFAEYNRLSEEDSGYQS